jgi:uncharacterized membrane protein YeaQ/YmgE (transglycosylase-associated protein family)
MFGFDSEVIVPVMIFAIPIVAVIGGITAGIVRTLGQQRLIELAQRERIAAIERGVDPSKLPPVSLATHDQDYGGMFPGGMFPSYHDYSRRRSQNMLIAGLILVFTGAALAVFLSQMVDGDDSRRVWLVGLIPAAVGAALLISSAIVRPRGNGGSGTPPHAS